MSSLPYKTLHTTQNFAYMFWKKAMTMMFLFQLLSLTATIFANEFYIPEPTNCQNEGLGCLNNGQCLKMNSFSVPNNVEDLETGGDDELYYCLCTAMYTGIRCGMHKACEDFDLCENGGICKGRPIVHDVNANERQLSSDGYYWNHEAYCECLPDSGFGGRYCNETNATPAPVAVNTLSPIVASELCFNLPGMPTTGDGECMCQVGWDGHICEACGVVCGPKSYSHCYLDAKLDDATKSHVIGFGPKCHCFDGYSGPSCELPPCDYDCLNGGECVLHEHDGAYFPACNCKDQWMGKFCTSKCVLECKNGGSCIVTHSDERQMCHCRGGWSGSNCDECTTGDCEEFEESCQHLECYNGGHCKRSRRGKETCVCQNTFGGDQCEYPAVQCNDQGSYYCLNGGTCVLEDNDIPSLIEAGADAISYRCECSTATYDNNLWSGNHCDKNVGLIVASSENESRAVEFLDILFISLGFVVVCSSILFIVKRLNIKKAERSHKSYIENLELQQSDMENEEERKNGEYFSTNYITNERRGQLSSNCTDAEII